MFSDNVDLQRSASLTFAEITERGTNDRHGSTEEKDIDDESCYVQVANAV